MQQRQLRLGDILDDYCPRERRLANHTIVAMVGDNIRLTRCTTCDTEHPYKDGKSPRLRKKKTAVEAAYGEVLESVRSENSSPAILASPADAPEPEANAAATDAAPIAAEGANGGAPEAPDVPDPSEPVRLHRPLIRAQLPRLEREPVSRPAPEFTIRQANKRQGRFQNSRPPGRFAKSPQDGQGNSRGPAGNQHGARQGGRPHGSAPPRPGPGRHQSQHPGGKKRSR